MFDILYAFTHDQTLCLVYEDFYLSVGFTFCGFIMYNTIPDFLNMIINRLSDAGYEAYIVGGAVRDICMNRPVTDWDITTSAASDKIKEIFHTERLFSLKHETVTILDKEGVHFELTPFRGKSGITGDLMLRDFTINAMALSPGESRIIDPANGLDDISKRLIRATGCPQDRFHEDTIRIIRAIRFAISLDFKIEDNTIRVVRQMCSDLKTAAPERIRDELNKILLSSLPSRAFNLMLETGILRIILPELIKGYKMAQNVYHRYTVYEHIMKTVDNIRPEPLLRWAALLHDIAKPYVRKRLDGRWVFYGHEEASAKLAEKILKRLRFSRENIRDITNLIRHHFIDYDFRWSDGAVRRLIKRVGKDRIMKLIELRKADLAAHGINNDWRPYMDDLEKRILEQTKRGLACIDIKDLAINGTTVMQHLGLPPSPEVGKILAALRDMVIDRPELNTKKKLISLLVPIYESVLGVKKFPIQR